MAAKKKEPTKKDAKDKLKAIEDKTFGLKNKNKSKAVKAYINTLKAQVTGSRPKTQDEIIAENKAKAAKHAEEKRKKLESNLAKAQRAMLLMKKSGAAQSETTKKIDIYADPRDSATSNMAEWDDETLQHVVEQRHAQHNQNKSSTICKYFLEAVENKLYGWLWQCPNGTGCLYRHALPPGYVLKSDRKPEVDPKSAISVLEAIEIEKAALPPERTPLTLELFLEWKRSYEARSTTPKSASASAQKLVSGRTLFESDSGKYLAADQNEENDDDIMRLIIQSRKAQENLDKASELEAQMRSEESKQALLNATSGVYDTPLEEIDPALLD